MILHWNYRNLQEFPLELLNNGEHVIEIYMKRNCLTALPKDIGKLKNLTNLYFMGNQISFLPTQIEELYNLKVLDLSQNLLSTLPSTVGNLRALEQLLVTNNQLISLPKELGQLKSLKFLELSGNCISNLPHEVLKGLYALEELAVDGNPILYFPRCISSLQNLRYISACKCNLLFLPGLPFHALVHGRTAYNRNAPKNAIPISSTNRQNFQILVDSNPRLNYLPYWVIQLLGKEIDCYGCAANQEDPIYMLDKVRNYESSQQCNCRGYKPSLGNSKQTNALSRIELNFKGKIHRLQFDEELMKIHPKSTNQPSTLLELCLRVVSNQDLQLYPHPHLDKILTERSPESHANYAVIQPCFKDNSMEIVESDSFSDKHKGHQINSSNWNQCVKNQPQLPQNLKGILDRGVVTKCFDCMKQIFTETWLVIFYVPENDNQVEVNPAELQIGIVRKSNQIKLSCIYFCSNKCLTRCCKNSNNSKSILPYENINFIWKNEINFI